jgi:plastocyanin
VSAAALCALLAPGVAAADQNVSVGDNFFSPDEVTIAVGETVTWTDAAGGNLHNVNFAGGLFDPPPAPSSGWSLSRTFTTVGSFDYVCDVHSSMAGTVTVTATAPPPGTPPPPGDNPGTPGGNPGTPGGNPGTPGGQPGTKKSATKITLKVSDATPRAGSRVRFYGSVTPAHDGRKVSIQKRGRAGSFKTVARTTLRDAGRARSTFSRRLRVRADGVYRARFGSVLSAKRRLDVST